MTAPAWVHRLARPRRLVPLLIALALLVVVLVQVVPTGDDTRTVKAEFPSAVGLYAGNEVRIRGVKVGTVDAVRQMGDHVEVVLKIDKKDRIPANVSALLVAQTLVTGRFVQLTPQYAGGPELAKGAVITDTHVPVEWDQVLSQLDAVAKALGPEGANRDGALTNLLQTGAKNLSGQGADLHATIANLSAALSTLSDGRGDLFGTITNLDRFVGTLKASDAQVADFNTQLDGVADLLASNRQQLAQVFAAIDASFANIQGFLAQYTGPLTKDLTELSQLMGTLSSQRQHLADVLQAGPPALSNFQNIYDPVSGGLTGVVAPLNGNSPSNGLCGLLGGAASAASETTCASVIDQLVSLGGPQVQSFALSSLVPTLATFVRQGACNQVTAAPGPATTDVHTVTCPAAQGGTSASTLSSLLAGGGR